MSTPAMERGEHGGAALLAVLGTFILLSAGLLVLSAVTDLGIAAARARTAADAAALAGAGASPLIGGDGDTCDDARRGAEANDGRLLRCRSAATVAAGASAGSAVEVEVAVEPRNALVRRLVGDVRARAAAGLRPGD